MERVIRLGGFTAFMASLAVCGWWWTTIAVRTAPGGDTTAAAIDVALFLVFALHHSVCARPWAKRSIEGVIPPNLVRSIYVWLASALLAAVCLAWRPVGGLAYSASGLFALALHLVQGIGVVLGILAVRQTSIGELSGAWDAGRPARLDATGVYGIVRHPLYSSLLLVLAGTSPMTGDRLLFTTLSAVFIVAAMPFEEAGLERQFGPAYAVYRARVRWRLIPYVH